MKWHIVYSCDVVMYGGGILQVPDLPLRLLTIHHSSAEQFLLFFDGGSRANSRPRDAGSVIVQIWAQTNAAWIVEISTTALCTSTTTSSNMSIYRPCPWLLQRYNVVEKSEWYICNKWIIALRLSSSWLTNDQGGRNSFVASVSFVCVGW